jgi:cytosine deaminase
MVTSEVAQLLGQQVRLRVGGPATFVLLEASSAVDVIRTVAQPLLSYKNGRPTFANSPAILYSPT